MSTVTSVRRFTHDEYLRMIEAGILHEDERVELRHGVIVPMAPIGPDHEESVDALTMLLAPRLAGRAVVRVQSSIRLDVRNAPQPDIVVLRLRPRRARSAPRGPEDVHCVIEVSDSSLAYDRKKLIDYARFGVPVAMIVDIPGQRVLVAREPGHDGYASLMTHRRGETITLDAFPDVTLSVDEILGPADD
jgi:Uma2 family endonuclease